MTQNFAVFQIKDVTPNIVFDFKNLSLSIEAGEIFSLTCGNQNLEEMESLAEVLGQNYKAEERARSFSVPKESPWKRKIRKRRQAQERREAKQKEEDLRNRKREVKRIIRRRKSIGDLIKKSIEDGNWEKE